MEVVKVASISIALIASGGIACLSVFDVPILKAQPASRSLPSIRWLFSRGSHIFPQAAVLSASGLVYVAIASRAPGRTVIDVLKVSQNSSTVNRYLLSVMLCLSAGPWTTFVMIPTNFDLVERNSKKGGARSSAAPSTRSSTAAESVSGKGEPSEFTDLSGPQERTMEDSSEKENQEVRTLLDRFMILNNVRAVLLAAGGLLALATAIA